jgi:serine phosphatase RsbU (regulator of sigma subunit)
MLQGTLGRTATEAVDAIAAELRSLVAATAQHDDIAFVIVDVLEQAETRKAA